MTTRTFSTPRHRIAGVILLSAMLAFGGGSIAGPVAYLLAQLCGFAMLTLALPGMNWAALYRQDRFAALLVIALVLLITAQLVPLPGAIWSQLSGRALYAAGDTLMFGQSQTRPLSLDPDETLGLLVSLAPALGIWLLARRSRDDAEQFVLVYFGFLAASLALALAQLAAGPGLLRLYPTTHADLPTGFFANRNHQSIAMVCGIPLAAALHRARRERGGPLARTPFLAVATLCCITGALLTGSRTGAALLLPSLAGSMLIAFGMQALTPAQMAAGNLGRTRAMRAAAGGFGAIALIAILVLAAATLHPGGALGLVFSRQFLADDPRYAFWPVVIGMIRDSLPWGTGLGSFRHAFEVASTPEVLRPLYINHAHNDWLEFTLEAGLPGLALALAFVAWLALRWRRAWSPASSHRSPLAQGAGLVLALLLAHSAFDYPLRTIALEACFACCAAILSWPPNAGPETESPRNRLIQTFAVLLAIVLTGTALNSTARYIALRAGTTEMALSLPAPGAHLLAARAFKLAEAGTPFGAVASAAVQAVAISPLTEPAFTAAGLAATDPAQAAALLDHAWLLSRRDPVLLAAQLRQARATRRPARAMAALDALYRLQAASPSLARELGPELARPDFMAQAVRTLDVDPRWRGQFLADLASGAGNAAILVELAAHMQLARHPLARSDLQAAIGALNFGPARDPAAAFRLWRMLAPTTDPLAWQAAGPSGGGLPYDWTLSDSARIVPSGSGLRLQYEGEQDATTPLATKRLPLAGGRYRIAIASNDPRATLEITCGSVQRRLLDGVIFDLPAPCPLADIAVHGTGGNGWIAAVQVQPTR